MLLHRTITLESGSVSLTLEKYPLALRTPFQTSHARTTGRNNALASITFTSTDSESAAFTISGHGECGLPPVNAVYLADLVSVTAFSRSLAERLAAQTTPVAVLDPLLAPLPVMCSPPHLAAISVANSVLSTIDQLLEDTDHVSRAAAAAWEAAALDLACIAANVPLWRLTCHRLHPVSGAGLPTARDHSPAVATQPRCLSYYTCGIGSVAEITESLTLGLSVTRAIKLKVDSPTYARTVLSHPLLLHANSVLIDANAALTPQRAVHLLEVALESPIGRQGKLIGIEQPFSSVLPVPGTEEFDAWAHFKDLAVDAGVHIVADESFRGVEDVPRVLRLVSAVNVKLEKTGGIRRALAAARAATDAGLAVWAGIMVVSTLGVQQTAAALAALPPMGAPSSSSGDEEAGAISARCACGDLDGALLVTPESDKFSGSGWTWGHEGVLELSEAPGLGALMRDQPPVHASEE
jgi:L-alanine-DL-glutamate epimerase-like enolase superfamily enzyme